MSYLSRVTYIGSGITGPYTVTFPYIEKSHVKVYLDGIETAAYTWTTTNSITFDTEIATGVIILIKRETPNDSRLVEFQNAALTKSSDFNTDSNQEFYLSQESIDDSTDSIRLNVALNWEANNKTIQNLATPVNPTDAATKAYADGGNLTACQEQVTLATAQANEAVIQAGIATAQANEATIQAGIATTQAGLAIDKAEQFEAILEPDGTTVKNATNALNANNALLADAAKGDTRFQLSGRIGGTGLAISSGATTNVQKIRIAIPDGKSLFLKKIRMNIDYGALGNKVQFKINNSGVSVYTTSYDASVPVGEETPNVNLGNAFGAEDILTIAVHNSDSTSRTISADSSWWCDFAIE